MLENTEGAITNRQSRESGNIDARRRKTKQKHNTICVSHHYTQTHTNNVNKKNLVQMQGQWILATCTHWYQHTIHRRRECHDNCIATRLNKLS